jgi:hypothetical protein
MTKDNLMTFDDFKAGISTMTMYFKKIIENPQVPRYRRILKANQNFKTLVEPLKGYDAVMIAVGFRDIGTCLEYYPISSSVITPTSSPIKSNNNDADADNMKQLLSTSIEVLGVIISSEGYDDVLQKLKIENEKLNPKTNLAPFPTVQGASDDGDRSIDNIINFDVISSIAKASISKTSNDKSSNDKGSLDSESKDDIVVKELSPIRR